MAAQPQVFHATSGIAHAQEQEKTLGFSPGLPPCREVLNSKHPVSESPLLPARSLGQGLLPHRAGLAWLRGADHEAQTFLFDTFPPSPLVRKLEG